MDNLEQRAKEIIEKILYITIATASKDGMPWNSPVYSAFDEKYNFYWCSDKESRHSQNIAENDQVALVIYDSSVPTGKGEGVYIQARAMQIIDKTEIELAHKLLSQRSDGFPWTVEELSGDNRPKAYKAVPKKVWMNKDGEVDGSFVDVRIEVPLLNK